MPSLLSAPDPRSLIATTGWLSTAPAGLRDAILAAGRFRDAPVGEVFNVAGDVDVGIWGLAAGQVALTSAMNAPDSPAALLYHPGDWGGFGPLFGYPRMGNVEARTASIILFVPFQAIRQILAANPGWWETMAALMFHYQLKYASFAVDLLLRNSRQRVAAILLHQADRRAAGDTPITLAVTQEELGEMTNLSRHPIGSTLRSFEADGLIGLGYRQIIVLQPLLLRTIANGE